MMKKQQKEITIFYCTRQRERVAQIVEGFNGSGVLKIRKVALPCSGKLEVFQLTKALENGADGIALFGCPEEECRYMVGSSRAKGRVAYTGKILETIGLEKERVRRFVLQSQPGQETLKAISDWAEKVKTMRPVLENLK
ncbi:MAG TPA: hydrogenase iron-sulfur subunit [Thermodesulfobacteriota bacterium]|nr:hydrogenase iron-sulfur subunit [Thermodesulfobacteriota bacterium]